MRTKGLVEAADVVALIAALGVRSRRQIEAAIGDWAGHQCTERLKELLDEDIQAYCRSVLDEVGLTPLVDFEHLNKYANAGLYGGFLRMDWSRCHMIDAAVLQRCSRKMARWFLGVMKASPVLLLNSTELYTQLHYFDGLQEALNRFQDADLAAEGVLDHAWELYLRGASYIEEDEDEPVAAGFGPKHEFEDSFEVIVRALRPWRAITKGDEELEAPPAHNAADRKVLKLGMALERLTAWQKAKRIKIVVGGEEVRPMWEGHCLCLSDDDGDALDKLFELINDGTGEVPGLNRPVTELIRRPQLLRSFVLTGCLSSAVGAAIDRMSRETE